MRNRLLIFLALLLPVINIMAQAPQGLNYQAVARNSSGAVLANQAVGIELTIISGSPTGTAVYEETNTATTNEFGLFSVVIGSGTPVTATLAGVNWAAGPMYLQVALDPTGGTNYTNYGTPTQLQSVPYALNAASSSQWYTSANDIINANMGYVGIGTTLPRAQLDIEETDGLDNVLKLSATETPLITVAMQNHNKFFLQDYLGAVYFYNYEDSDMSFGVNTNTEIMHFEAANKSVGIGTALPATTLDVQGNVSIGTSSASEATLNLRTSSLTSLVQGLTNGLLLGTGLANTDPQLFFDQTNNSIDPNYTNVTSLGESGALFTKVYATDGTIQTSDMRMKKNIENLNMGLKEVMALRPVSYEWIKPSEGDGQKIGFIAQEVEKVVPQAVVHDYISDKEIEAMKAMNKPLPEIRDPYAMNYSEMIPVLTKAIQEQQAMIMQLQKEVELLKSAK